MLPDPTLAVLAVAAVLAICYGVEKIRQSQNNRLYETKKPATPTRCHCSYQLRNKARSSQCRH